MRILLFHNWSSLGYAVAQALMKNGEDELVLVGAAVEHPDVALLEDAALRGVPCGMVDDVEGEAFSRDMTELEADVAIVATFPRKLPAGVLGRLPLGAFNVHPSLLPAYRGPSPEFWALRNGDAETGVTIHELTNQFDAGAIVAQAHVAIAKRETGGSLDDKLSAAAAALVVDFVGRLRSGETIPRRKQDESAVTRAPLPREEDLAVSFEADARSIERLVRACDPTMLAKGALLGEPVGLVNVRLAEENEHSALAPGELHFDADEGTLYCGTGTGALVLDDIDIAGQTLDGEELATRLGLGPTRDSSLN
jgi:methionyl-tRNA formyltransferase